MPAMPCPRAARFVSRPTISSKEQSQDLARDKLPRGEYVVCEVSRHGHGHSRRTFWTRSGSRSSPPRRWARARGLASPWSMASSSRRAASSFATAKSARARPSASILPRHYPKLRQSPRLRREGGSASASRLHRARAAFWWSKMRIRSGPLRCGRSRSRGYTVVEADSGERGLEVIEEDKDGFELILSDVVMPEMDGPTMLAEIRKRGITTKFIFMSGYAEDAFERNLENPDDFAFMPEALHAQAIGREGEGGDGMSRHACRHLLTSAHDLAQRQGHGAATGGGVAGAHCRSGGRRGAGFHPGRSRAGDA